MNYQERFDNIKNLILDYESGNKKQSETIDSINEITVKGIDEYYLNNYWRSDHLDTVVRVLSIDQIDNWADIDDNRALVLIKEILDDLSDDGIILRNSEALEKRYKKSTGTITDLIFYSNKNSKEEIFSELKKDTIIKL